MTHPVDREPIVRRAIEEHWKALLSPDYPQKPEPLLVTGVGMPLCSPRCPLRKNLCVWGRQDGLKICDPAVRCLIEHIAAPMDAWLEAWSNPLKPEFVVRKEDGSETKLADLLASEEEDGTSHD